MQFHPEFKSRPLAPQAVFKGFIGAAKEASRGGGVGGSLDGRTAADPAGGPLAHDDTGTVNR